MTKTKYVLSLIKGLAAILLAAFAILGARDYFAKTWAINIPEPLFGILVPVVLMVGIWVGAGDFIRELITQHKNKTRS